MDAQLQGGLKWLGDQHFQEIRALRSAEDNLFNWATSVFLAGFGALTGLRGMTTAQWSLAWRLLVIFGLIAVICVILLIAYLIRRSYEENQKILTNIIQQLGQTNIYPPQYQGAPPGDDLVFYLKWGGFTAVGIISLFLVWMLG